MTPKWRALVVRGELSGDLLRELADASGAYAVREKDGHKVVYVGESHTGALRKTMLRHFHASKSFKADRRPAHGAATFATSHPERYEVAIWITSRGKRSKSSADEKAMAAQAKWIETLRPEKNIDAGVTEPFEQAEEEDTWGGLLNPDSPMARALAKRIAAMRLELAEAERWKREGRPGSAAMVSALKRDLLEQEKRLANLVQNPALIAMGKLTALSYRSGAKVSWCYWPIRNAPTLAYDGAKRLHVLYTDRAVRPSSEAEAKEYRRAHWGESGEGKVRDAREAVGPFSLFGPGVGIVYTTRKGDDAKIVDYEHPWGSGRRGPFTPPKVIGHRCGVKRCPLEGAIALSGGSYTVTEHGIVG